MSRLETRGDARRWQAVRRLFLLVLMLLIASSEAALAVVLKLGDILVVEPGNAAVSVVDAATGVKTTISQGGLLLPTHRAVGVALALDGSIIVVVRDRGLIRVNAVTGAQSILSQGGLFRDPWAIAVDHVTGSIYVADSGYDNDRPSINEAGKIIKVDPVTGAQQLIASGSPCNLFPSGAACQNTTSAGSYIAHPYGIAVDYTGVPGTLIVGDMSSFNGKGAIFRLQPVPNGTQTLLWGPSTAIPAPVVNQVSPLGCPMGVRVEPNGNILTTVFTYPVPSTPAFPPPAGTYYGCAPPGIYRIDLSAHTQTVVNANAPLWRSSHAYALGSVVVGSGHVHRVITAGVSQGSAPSWNSTLTGTTSDGSIVWQNIGRSENWLIPFGVDIEPTGASQYNIILGDEGHSMLFRLTASGALVSGGPFASSLPYVTSIDVISFTPQGGFAAPVRSNGQPVGTLPFGTTQTSLSLTTNVNTTCRYATTAGVAYGSMPNVFSTTGTTTHSTNVTGLTNGTSYNFYVRCQDTASNVNTDDFVISFSIASAADSTPPARSNGQPTGTLSGGTTQASLSLTTNENATCRYATTAGIAYASMPTVFSTTGAIAHSTIVSGLTNGTSYTFYVRCQDVAGNPNPNDFAITFSVSATGIAGLVAAYGFNEGAGTAINDVSGNNLTGTITGATWIPDGRFGNALSFNGSSNLITVPHNTVLNLTTGMTLEAWIYPTATSGVHDVIIKEGAGFDIYNLYASNWRGLPESNILQSTNHIAEGSTGLTANVWTHIAGTYDGSTLRLYINGVQVASTNTTGAITTSTGALRIGGNTLWGEYFQGRIDEVRVYNRALTQAEIQSDMNAAVGTLPGDATPPVLSNGQPTGTLAAGTTQTAISLATNENATCRYATTAGIAYGSMPNVFTTTGALAHSANVTSLTNGSSYTYYVRCQDTATNVNTSDFAISFSVASASDTTPPVRSNGQPTGTLAAGTTQTAISLATNENATCRYATTAGIAYGSMPNVFTTTGTLAHATTISGLTNGTSYTFYVRCQDTATNPNPDDFVISFSVAAVADTTPPVRSNGLPTGILSGGTSQTTLSLATNENATCRYATTTGVAYGSMTNTFSTTGALAHSTLVTGLTNGTSYNFYVRCVDTAANANTNDFTISFSVGTSATATSTFTGVENPLSESGVWDSAGSWIDLQKNAGAFTGALNAGARRVTPAMASNQYSEITYNENPGSSSWVGVMTRVQGAANGSGYLAIAYAGEVRLYRTDDAGFLNFTQLAGASVDISVAPRRLRLESQGNNHRVLFNGVQLISHNASGTIYASGQPGIAASVFGGPSVKILTWEGGDIVDTTPPVRSNGLPAGALAGGTTQTSISLATSENATCRYASTAGIAYGSMPNVFTTTGALAHSTTVTGLTNGSSYNFYVRCQDEATNANPDDFVISFSVAADSTPPVRSNGQPTGTLAAGATQTAISLATNENATCRYATTAGIAYGSMPNVFTTTGTLAHSTTVTGLTNGSSYNFYVRCVDTATNANTNDFAISFSVAAVADTTPPVRSNGLPTGTLSGGTSQTTLSLATNENATCRYATTAGVAYGSMTNTFSTTGALAHSTLVTGLTNGTSYNFYVRCVDTAANANTNDFTISFSVGTSATATSTFTGVENPLSESGVWDSAGSWIDLQKNAGAFTGSLNAGARRVTPAMAANQYSEITYNENPGSSSWVGVMTRAQGAANGSGYLAIAYAGEVRLYRTDDAGSLNFTQLAGASVDISVAPRRLRLESQGNNHRVLFNGVQLISHNASGTIYANGQPGIAASVFGGPSVKILTWEGGDIVDTTPPVRSSGLPTGVLAAGTTQTAISLATSENATCRYATTAGIAYGSMPNVFTTTGALAHSTTVTGLTNGSSYNFYVRCVDTATNANPDDFVISFSIGN